MTDFSYCETAAATGRWCIRVLSSEGRKPNGGADTKTLCGFQAAWDVPADPRTPINPEGEFRFRPHEPGGHPPGNTCRVCSEIYQGMQGAETSWDALTEEVLQDPVARVSYRENNLRREIADRVAQACEQQGISVEALASRMGCSSLQVRRLLHMEVGGNLSLTTIVRAADALGLQLRLSMKTQNPKQGEKQ